jgi:hypothetical protein
MIGRDALERPMASWQALAGSFRTAQLERIRRAAQQVLSRNAIAPESALVAAGSGAFLVPELARALHRPAIEFLELVEPFVGDPAALSICAPAVAVAILALRAHA